MAGSRAENQDHPLQDASLAGDQPLSEQVDLGHEAGARQGLSSGDHDDRIAPLQQAGLEDGLVCLPDHLVGAGGAPHGERDHAAQQRQPFRVSTSAGCRAATARSARSFFVNEGSVPPAGRGLCGRR